MTNPHIEVEIARRYLVKDFQGVRTSTDDKFWLIAIDERVKNFQTWRSLPDRILAASPHLQGYDVPGEEIDRLKAEGLTLVEALEMLGM